MNSLKLLNSATKQKDLDVLIVEDSVASAIVYQQYLCKDGFNTRTCGTGEAALAELKADPPQILLQDVQLPDMSGIDILQFVRDNNLPTAVIVMTSDSSVEIAVDAMRGGAFDFIEKPFSRERLIVTVSNAVKQQGLLAAVRIYRDEIDRPGYCDFIGGSLCMQVVYRIIDSAATSKATVFIAGESGTGKELCAQAIHNKSKRTDKAFIALNCAAVPAELFESEIFGHVRGAFSGASANRKGAAELADGGTLFLDEICEMNLALQAKLLRFTQTGTFQSVGSSETKRVDVRIVCATNRDPLTEVAAGRFREDLYYRLNVVPITLPPLRDRDTDVLQIAQKLLGDYASQEEKSFKTLAPEVERMFVHYDWPGNVRELQNAIRNAVILNQGDVLTMPMLSGAFPTGMPDAPENINAVPIPVEAPVNFSRQPEEIEPLWITERRAIEKAINHCDGNIPIAAAYLGVSASTLYRKRRAWTESTHSGPAETGYAKKEI